MALFSKEYYESVNQTDIPDFSIVEEFQKLKKNQSIDIICEGFGITKIINKNNVCFVEVMFKEIVLFKRIFYFDL